jgi:hypothetical protein
MRKNIFLTALLFMLVFSIAGVANALVLSSEYIYEAKAEIVVNSQGTATVSFRINGTGMMDVLGAKTIIVQEKAPGSSQWTAVATYKASDYPNMLKNNTSVHSSSISYYDTKSDCSYRAKVYFYAEKGGYETVEYIAD